MRRPVLNIIQSGALDSIITPMKWVFGIIFVLFCDAIRQTMSRADVKQGQDNFAAFKDNQAKLFRAERNLYLSGATVVLLVVLNRLYTLSRDFERAERNADMLQKQAKQNAEFQAMLDKSKGDDKKKGGKKEESQKEEFPAVPKGAVKEETGMKQRKNTGDKKTD